MPPKTYALGLYGIGCYTILWMLSLKLAPPLEANTLNYLWPAMLIVFSALAAKKLPTLAAVIGCCICFTGSCFLFARNGLLQFDSAHFWGLVAGVAAAVIWGSYSTMTKYVKFQSDRIAVFCLISGLLMWPLHLYFEETVWPQSPQIALAIVVYGISRVTFILWDYAMKEGQTTLLASLSYFTPLLSILCLTLAGFATYTFHVTVGAVMIIAGCIVINLPQMIQAVRKRKAAANP